MNKIEDEAEVCSLCCGTGRQDWVFGYWTGCPRCNPGDQMSEEKMTVQVTETGSASGAITNESNIPKESRKRNRIIYSCVPVWWYGHKLYQELMQKKNPNETFTAEDVFDLGLEDKKEKE
jgi:hypothetical protein